MHLLKYNCSRWAVKLYESYVKEASCGSPKPQRNKLLPRWPRSGVDPALKLAAPEAEAGHAGDDLSTARNSGGCWWLSQWTSEPGELQKRTSPPEDWSRVIVPQWLLITWSPRHSCMVQKSLWICPKRPSLALKVPEQASRGAIHMA